MDFFYGVIEGFFGRQWSWQARRDYAAFLTRHHFNCYIYAPKGDPYLRDGWSQPWPGPQIEQLGELSNHYHRAGLRFGIGFSPMGLFDDYQPLHRQQIKHKLEAINSLGVDILCILFDDMRGDYPQLAKRQLAIVDDILAVSQAGQHMVCPTYYSFDPALDRLFGRRPDDYLKALSKGLPRDIAVLWTGNQIITEKFTQSDIERVSDLVERKPVLWDNYWANDGERISRYLMLKPCVGRPYQLKYWTQGHCVNPMNQAYLSQLPLVTLAQLYTMSSDYQAQDAWQCALNTIECPIFRGVLSHDSDLFANKGVCGLDDAKRSVLLRKYQQFTHPAAVDIVHWLEGKYQFDPACLTP